MEMQAQQVLAVAAAVAFALGLAMFAASLRFYVTRDIRGVRDDLAGRTRERAMRARRARASASRDKGEPDHGWAAHLEPSAASSSPSAEPFEVTKDICLVNAEGWA